MKHTISVFFFILVIVCMRKIFYGKRKFIPILIKKITSLTTAIRFIFNKYHNMLTFFFLRKNKTFIKSKYSRTRQWSKVIVFFGLWYGVINVFFMMFYTYKLIFILSFFWWVPATFCTLIILKNFKKYFVFFKNWISIAL